MKIKQLTLILFATVIFYGCQTTIPTQPIKDVYNGNNIRVATIDSCEYLFVNMDVRSITHKGNCKFCAERNKSK
jgi:cellobiose-specific phosphotransferase system component IIB